MLIDSSSKVPELSIIIVVVSDAKHLEGCLNALSQQVNAPTMEIIVPYDGRDRDIQSLRIQYPKVQFYKVTNLQPVTGITRRSHEYFDKMRAIGLDLARGGIVALLEDHDRPDKYWSMKMIEAHKGPYAAVGGAIDNGINRPLNWAIYFCDFGPYQNPIKNGPSTSISDVNVSYKQKALHKIRNIWENSYHEPNVHNALLNLGEELWLSPEIVVYQHRENLDFCSALLERYNWGLHYAGFRTQRLTISKRLLCLTLSPVLPFVLLLRKINGVLRKRRCIIPLIRAIPIMMLLLSFWSLGEFIGYLTAKTDNIEKWNTVKLSKCD